MAAVVTKVLVEIQLISFFPFPYFRSRNWFHPLHFHTFTLASSSGSVSLVSSCYPHYSPTPLLALSSSLPPTVSCRFVRHRTTSFSPGNEFIHSSLEAQRRKLYHPNSLPTSPRSDSVRSVIFCWLLMSNDLLLKLWFCFRSVRYNWNQVVQVIHRFAVRQHWIMHHFIVLKYSWLAWYPKRCSIVEDHSYFKFAIPSQNLQVRSCAPSQLSISQHPSSVLALSPCRFVAHLLKFCIRSSAVFVPTFIFILVVLTRDNHQGDCQWNKFKL